MRCVKNHYGIGFATAPRTGSSLAECHFRCRESLLWRGAEVPVWDSVDRAMGDLEFDDLVERSLVELDRKLGSVALQRDGDVGVAFFLDRALVEVERELAASAVCHECSERVGANNAVCSLADHELGVLESSSVEAARLGAGQLDARD